jgi:hypothetical protein
MGLGRNILIAITGLIPPLWPLTIYLVYIERKAKKRRKKEAQLTEQQLE